ncbi:MULTISPECIES: ketopantoate reductase family protein [Atopobiaceae]|uniref:2-dehydropantoate 2-reductase n=1 Tax=Parafannyhessea umbonata TaxID=604330 RepID=A0A1H9P880_9ACTN|nr:MULTISPECIES: 2-dehydropantoate 2-reductase [Atopobiaceae]SEH43869.1 2-dehydropantoate 2-reductase [Parafannyhessea umbonata]SER44504.1 2-dehydropantoate 2-reductase [Parafannyhessea umbonata]SJZ58776.1 2-dehydropantoate 2-reductase [Olsenella sp. KH1P3]
MRIAIVGKGALGLLYADAVCSELGRDAVVFVMDAARLARHAKDAYTVNGQPRDFADATPERAGKADLVIVATKATGLSAALDLMGPLLRDDTPIVSVLNGVRSEEVIAGRFGWERVVPCVARGMDAARYGCDLSYTKPGALHVGRFERTPAATFERARELMGRAGIPLVAENDIRRTMWEKFVLNVGINQCCAAYGLPYGGILGDQAAEPFRMLVAAMREVVALARAEGVELDDHVINVSIELELGLDQGSTPSMGQDRINRVPSEVDEFAGEVIRRAERHGILVPANRWLLERMRQIEAAY